MNIAMHIIFDDFKAEHKNLYTKLMILYIHTFVMFQKREKTEKGDTFQST